MSINKQVRNFQKESLVCIRPHYWVREGDVTSKISVWASRGKVRISPKRVSHLHQTSLVGQRRKGDFKDTIRKNIICDSKTSKSVSKCNLQNNLWYTKICHISNVTNFLTILKYVSQNLWLEQKCCKTHHNSWV